jgi:1-aminocyclopropane-1-carboxylate deaminase/D-cysteine desulfhydrase-like pyridoxal-dependent ACC family enzyme
MGRSPYIAPIGGSLLGGSMDLPLGSIAYVDAFLELAQQAAEMDTKVDYVVHATGSGSTQAGLAVGAKAVNPEIKIVGISVSEDKKTIGEDVLTIARDTEKALDLKLDMNMDDIIVLDEYLGEGYGIVNKEISQTLRLISQQEGIFLDPVYTGKAWMGLEDLIHKGYFKPDDTIVFLHTGGTPALFPNKRFIGEYLANK